MRGHIYHIKKKKNMQMNQDGGYWKHQNFSYPGKEKKIPRTEILRVSGQVGNLEKIKTAARETGVLGIHTEKSF